MLLFYKKQWCVINKRKGRKLRKMGTIDMKEIMINREFEYVKENTFSVINDINELWRMMEEEVTILSYRESNIIQEKVKILKDKESEYRNILDSIVSLLFISNISKSTLDDISIVTNSYIKYINIIKEKGESIRTYDTLCNLLGQIPNRFYNYITEKIESYTRQEKIPVNNKINKRVKVNMKKIELDSDMPKTSSIFEDVFFITIINI